MFALDEAAASTSAKCPESLASSPKAVSASVTMSDVVARSSPDAAARFMMPSRPSSMSSVFQPAIAMYVMPSAASDAENFVLDPISLALSRSLSKSSPVAPEIALTLLMEVSKSAVVFTAAAPTAARGRDTVVVSFVPTLVILLPTSCRFWPTACILVPATVATLSYSFLSFLSCCSLASMSRLRAFWASDCFFPPSCFSSSFSAFFSALIFSFVWFMASFKYPCFCLIISVLDGLNFSRLLVSRKAVLV